MEIGKQSSMLSTARHAQRCPRINGTGSRRRRHSEKLSVRRGRDGRHIRGLPPMSTSHFRSLCFGWQNRSTPEALGKCRRRYPSRIQRHLSGDWADVDEHDRQVNNHALEGVRACSPSSISANRREILDITEPDRSASTVLLPETTDTGPPSSGGGFFSPQNKERNFLKANISSTKHSWRLHSDTRCSMPGSRDPNLVITDPPYLVNYRRATVARSANGTISITGSSPAFRAD